MTEKMEALRKHYRDVRRRMSEWIDSCDGVTPRADPRLFDDVLEALDAVPALTVELKPTADTATATKTLPFDLAALLSHYLFLRVGAELVCKEFDSPPKTQEEECVKIARVATCAAMFDSHPKAVAHAESALKSIEPLSPVVFGQPTEVCMQHFRTMYQDQADESAMEARAAFRRKMGLNTPKPPASA